MPASRPTALVATLCVTALALLAQPSLQLQEHEVPTVDLAVGEVVTVEVEYNSKHNYIFFIMAGKEDSSWLGVRAATKEGVLWFLSHTGCPARYPYSGCLYDHDGSFYRDAKYEDYDSFMDNKTYVFEVQRRPTEMAVWLKNSPSRKLSVPIIGGKLTVSPEENEQIPIKVKITGSSQSTWPHPRECNPSEFKCKDNTCVKLLDRCSGTKECEDGSDEASCDPIPERSMRVGDVLTVRVRHSAGHGGVDFLLCDGSSCSRIHVAGATPDGKLAFTADTGCNAQGGSLCSRLHSDQPAGWAAFPAGNLTFEVQRRPTELAVWLENHAGKKVTVRAWRGSDTLRVRPHLWVSEMPVDFDGPHCGSTPAAPQTLTVNGEATDLGIYPWHAAIYEKIDGKNTYICGGSLISRTMVMSVAHCFVKRYQLQPAQNYNVALGKIFSAWEHDEEATVFTSPVKRIRTHPYYQSERRQYGDDIALLELAQEVQLSDYIQPICFDEELVVRTGDDIRVVGWGGDLSRLETVNFKYESFSSCLNKIQDTPAEVKYLTRDKFCTFHQRGVKRPPGVAKGDSGSGAVAKRGSRWFLVGLVSTVISNKQVYTFTDVSKHSPWTTDEIEGQPGSHQAAYGK